MLGTVGRERVHCRGVTSPVLFGGTAFHAAEAILKGGSSQPVLVSALGNDLALSELVGQFSGPVNTCGLQHNQTLPSFYWEARYEDSLEVSTTESLENRLIAEFSPDWLSLSSRSPSLRFCYLAAFDPSVQLSCSQHFDRSFIVSETLEYWVNRNRRGVFELADASNGFVVTEREFKALWHLEAMPNMTHERVMGIVEQHRLDFLIVTFADRGSQVFDAEGTFVVPALRCDTVDPTGAGNAFTGGIAACLAQHGEFDRKHLLDAVVLGTALASLQVRDFSNRALRAASTEKIADLRQEVYRSV